MFIQKANPPELPVEHFDLNRFEGGLNNVSSPLELNQTSSPNLMNVINFQPGVCETRPGLFKYITDQIPETIKRIYAFETDSFKYLMLSSDTKLYKVPVDGGVPTVVCTLNGVASGVQYEKLFYFVDGKDYRYYDGTNVYTAIDPTILSAFAKGGSSVGITLADDSNATDGYYIGWQIRIVSGTGNGQVRTISSYAGATKVAVVDTNWTTAPDTTSLYYLTNTEQGKTTVHEDAKTFVYVPNYQQFTDTFYGANNMSMVSKCTMLTLHKQRMVFAGDPAHKNMVYYSATANLAYVPANQWIPPVTNNDDYVTGIYSFNDVLTIWKQRTVFALYGYDETDFDLREVTVACGTINPLSIVQLENSLLFFGTDGKVYSLYDVRTDYKKLLTKDLTTGIIDLMKPPINVFPDDWANAFAIQYENKYYLSVKDKILVFTGTGWLVWDNINPTAFFKYSNQFILTNANKYIYRLTINRFYVTETFTATQGQTDFTLQRGYINEIREDTDIYVNNVLVDLNSRVKLANNQFQIPACSAGDTVRIEYLSLLSYNDDGESYQSYFESKDMSFNRLDKSKQFRYMWVTADTFKFFSSKLSVNAYVDYYDVNLAIAIENQIALWGVAKWGVSRFIDRNIVAPTRVPIGRRGRIIRFRVESNSADQPFRLFGITGDVTLRDR